MDEKKKRSLITKAAKLYYQGNMTQDEIARMLNISRSKVSRLITAAHQYNIVQVYIKDPVFSHENAGTQLCKHFGLKKVIVVPTGQNIQEAKENIGYAATDFLNESLYRGIRIGIGWGTTLNAFVHRFKASQPYPDAKVIQISGGTYSQAMHMDCRELVKTLAGKLGCESQILQLPMIVHNPQLQQLMMEEPETQEHFRLFKKIDMAFVGIGSTNYKDSVAYKAKYITEEEAIDLYAPGVCDICGHPIDLYGKPADTILNDRVISIPLRDLEKIPMVVGMCAGNTKAASIIANIRGGYVDALIIDEIAAISLMEFEGLTQE